MEYTVVSVELNKPYVERSIEKLRSIVNQLIRQGWIPLGGIAIHDLFLLQAMTRVLPR